jgi:hypothetical protein
MANCCVNCFEDDSIVEFIESSDEIGNCEYCDSVNVNVSDTEAVGVFIREGLARGYELIDDSGLYRGYENKGIDVFEILYDLEILSEMIYDNSKDTELLKDLIIDSGPSHCDIKDGAQDWLDGGDALLVIRNEYYGYEDNKFVFAWNKFKYQVKHFARFFEFEENYHNKEEFLAPITELTKKMAAVLSKGTQLWRGRIAYSDIPISVEELQKAVGPPPVEFSAYNRMSPAGISYTYLCDAIETCLAEIRPHVGNEVWLGSFIIKNDLNLLDLTHIPFFGAGSIFDPDYDHDMLWAKWFMEKFSEEISKPIVPQDTTLEYVPTQIFSEFIRKSGYNGIKYKSSQSGKGVNYTIFCGPIENIEEYSNHHLIPFTEYMYLNKFELVKATAIEIKYEANDWTNKWFNKEISEHDYPAKPVMNNNTPLDFSSIKF